MRGPVLTPTYAHAPTKLATLARRHTHDPLAYTRDPCSPSQRFFRGADITPPTQPFLSFSFSCFFLLPLCACYARGRREARREKEGRVVKGNFSLSAWISRNIAFEYSACSLRLLCVYRIYEYGDLRNEICRDLEAANDEED